MLDGWMDDLEAPWFNEAVAGLGLAGFLCFVFALFCFERGARKRLTGFKRSFLPPICRKGKGIPGEAVSSGPPARQWRLWFCLLRHQAGRWSSGE